MREVLYENSPEKLAYDGTFGRMGGGSLARDEGLGIWAWEYHGAFIYINVQAEGKDAHARYFPGSSLGNSMKMRQARGF